MNDEWKEFCSGQDLWLRASCNQVLDASSRPVSTFVVDALSRDPRAAALYREFGPREGSSSAVEHPSPLPDGVGGGLTTAVAIRAFFRTLTEDARWKTLILEHETQRRALQGFMARAMEFLTKARPQLPEAAVKTVSKAASLGIAITVGAAGAEQLNVGLRIRPEFDAPAVHRVRIEEPQVSASPSPTPGASPPVCTGSPSPTPTPLAMTLNSPGVELALDQLRGSVNKLESAVSTVAGVGSRNEEHVARLEASLTKIDTSLATVATKVAEAGQQVSKESAAAVTEATRVAKALASQPSFILVPLVEGRTKSIDLTFFTPENELVRCMLNIEALSIRTSVKLRFTGAACSPHSIEPIEPEPMRRTDVRRLEPLGLEASVDEVLTPRLRRKTALLRLTRVRGPNLSHAF